MALFDVLLHEHERFHLNPILEAATRAETLARRLRKLENEAVETAVLVGTGQATLRVSAQSELTTAARQLANSMDCLTSDAEALGRRLRSNAWSKQLQQPSTRKPSDLLLTGVWQHLDWGGLTYEEIFELVPSTGTVANIKDLVRSRIKGPNARSLMPRELHPALFEAPKVEKRRRRRSST